MTRIVGCLGLREYFIHDMPNQIAAALLRIAEPAVRLVLWLLDRFRQNRPSQRSCNRQLKREIIVSYTNANRTAWQLKIRTRTTEAQGTNDRNYVVCPDCGKPMSASALLCRDCYKRAGANAAPIYQAARQRGEASDRSSRRAEDTPPRWYHKRGDQKR